MFRQATIVLVFVGLAVLLSCKKDKVPCTNCTVPENPNCEDIQNVKKFFAFKVGSWWLYEEENSGARDSVYVTQYANNPNNYNFDVRMYSTYQDYYYHFWSVFSSGAQDCSESGSICKWCLTIKRSKYKPGDFVAQGDCFIFLMKIGDFSTTSNSVYPNNKIIITNIHDTFTLVGLDFQRTVKIHELNTFMEGKQPTNHYFSENVGLIRKELLDSNQVWNLIDYHIEE